jgi:hypothetical protein
MVRCEFEEFDPYRFVEPHQERRFGGGSLCGGCKHAHLYRRRDKLDLTVYCHELSRYVPPDVVECSQFDAVAALSLRQMQEIACRSIRGPGQRRQLSLRLGA